MGFNLLPKQQTAIEQFVNTKDSLIVNAVPGAGKTFMISQFEKHLNGDSAVFLAYNRSSADSLSEKLPDREVRTINGFGYKHLRNVTRRWNLRADKYRRIVMAWALTYYDDSDTAWQEIGRICKSVDFLRITLTDIYDDSAIVKMVDEYELYDVFEFDLIDAYRAIIHVGNIFAEDARVVQDYIDAPLNRKHSDRNVQVHLDIIEEGFTRNVGSKNRPVSWRTIGRWIDFTDQVVLPIIWDLPIDKYDVVFGDEFQDQNSARLELCLRAVAPNGRLVVVGDAQQAINGWCGADSMSLHKTQVRTNATLLFLDQSFRCPVTHTALARTETGYDIFSVNTDKNGRVEEMDLSKLKSKISDHYHRGDEMLVLSRINAPLASLAMGLLASGIPCVVRGNDFAKSISSVIKKIALDKYGKAHKRGFEWDDFPMLLSDWQAAESKKLVNKRAGEESFERLSDKYHAILSLYDGFDGDSAVDFKAYIEGMFSDSRSELIVLSSVHRAKGQESETVAILSPGKLLESWGDSPTAEQMRQTRNVAFVAYTRSLNSLYLVDEGR